MRHPGRWYAALFVPAALSGCRADAGAVVVQVEGQLTSYADQSAVAGGEVTLEADDGTALGSGETDSDGLFAFAIAAPYDAEDGMSVRGDIVADGFVPTSFWRRLRIADVDKTSLSVVPGRKTTPAVVFLSTVPLSPVSDAPGDVSGIVYDATVGDTAGIAGLTLDLREGLDPPSDADVVATTTTGEGGEWSFAAVPAGTYTAFVNGDDTWLSSRFQVVSVGGTPSDGQRGDTTPVLDDDQFRMTLTWGELPEDLDAHLTGPIPKDERGDDGLKRFHVFFNDRAFPGGTVGPGTDAFVDVDDTLSFGPETVTAQHVFSGTYRYSVHDFTNREATTSTALSFSSARVELFAGRDTFESYDVPIDRDGTVWTVLEIDGDTLRSAMVNDFGFVSDPADAEAF